MSGARHAADDVASMREWRQSRPVFYRFRWWLFRRLSELGWWIAPEPERSALRAYMDLSKSERQEFNDSGEEVKP